MNDEELEIFLKHIRDEGIAEGTHLIKKTLGQHIDMIINKQMHECHPFPFKMHVWTDIVLMDHYEATRPTIVEFDSLQLIAIKQHLGLF